MTEPARSSGPSLPGGTVLHRAVPDDAVQQNSVPGYAVPGYAVPMTVTEGDQ